MSRKNKNTSICSIRLSNDSKTKVMKLSEKEHRSFAEQCGFIIDSWLSGKNAVLKTQKILNPVTAEDEKEPFDDSEEEAERLGLK